MDNTLTYVNTEAPAARERAVAIADAIRDTGQYSVTTGVHYEPDAQTWALRVRVPGKRVPGKRHAERIIFDLLMPAPGAIPALFRGGAFVGLGGARLTDDPSKMAIILLARIAAIMAADA